MEMSVEGGVDGVSRIRIRQRRVRQVEGAELHQWKDESPCVYVLMEEWHSGQLL